MNHQEKLKTLKSIQEIINREFGRRVKRSDLICLATTVRIAIDFMDFLNNSKGIVNPVDPAVADMHEMIHSGLDSIYALRRIHQTFHYSNNGWPDQEYVWSAGPDFKKFKETYLVIFAKLPDVNIGAESRLRCLMDLARMELVFLSKTL